MGTERRGGARSGSKRSFRRVSAKKRRGCRKTCKERRRFAGMVGVRKWVSASVVGAERRALRNGELHDR